MSRKNRRIINDNEVSESKTEENSRDNKEKKKKSFWKGLGSIEKVGIIGLSLLLVVGVMGSSLGDSIIKTITGDSNSANSQNSLLSRLNPFAAAPMPSGTPQLSKEYVYAGGRMLAVVDANATEVPPADLAIWRPSSGQWWVMAGPGTQQAVQGWGTNGDIPVPGDYDGDGKTDFTVFRPSTNMWYFVNSSDSSTGSFPFGASGDKPAPADFDGDGKTDVAVYRPSNGTWYIKRSTDNGTTIQQYGISTDLPAPADYDGDGKADITVWRDSDTNFYSLLTTTSSSATTDFSSSSTEPVSGDYDGDGFADYAIRNSTNWIIRNSSTNQTQTTSWYAATDKGVPNDYDGDGKVDIAVWRDSNGYWYIRQSSQAGQSGELRQVQWGTTGDIPVPAYYKR